MNKISNLYYTVVFYIFLAYSFTNAQDAAIIIREDFNDLENWTEIYFSGNKSPTQYTICNDNENIVLKIASENSASAIRHIEIFNPYEFPFLRWRWRVDSLPCTIDGRDKLGDDYAIRLFILFAFDRDSTSFWQDLQNTAFEMVSGYEKPHSGLIFVWANLSYSDEFFISPYSDDLVVWNMRQGEDNLYQWYDEKIHIIEYYKKAFGKNPPKSAALILMGDSDNNGTSGRSFMDFIEVSRHSHPSTQ